jgi:Reverse transcriptase (RNA-dependent DNA polymerase)
MPPLAAGTSRCWTRWLNQSRLAACCGWLRAAAGCVLRLVRLFLEALVQDGYRLVRPSAGTPQGGFISPLPSNLYFAGLDQVLDAEGMSYVRYADDVRLTSRTRPERSTR